MNKKLLWTFKWHFWISDGGGCIVPTSLHFYFTLNLNLNLMPQLDQKDNWHFREIGIGIHSFYRGAKTETKLFFCWRSQKQNRPEKKKICQNFCQEDFFRSVEKYFSIFFCFRLSNSVKWHSTHKHVNTHTHGRILLEFVCYTLTQE